MRKGILIIAAISAFIAASCQRKTIKEELASKKERNEIFDQILGNEEYMSDFMAKMSESETGRAACMRDIPMMQTMWESDQMDSLMGSSRMMMETMINRLIRKMEKDTSTCSMMCHRVMENGRLKSYVIAHACKTTDIANKKQYKQ